MARQGRGQILKTVLKVRVVHLEDCAATPATLDLVARAAAELGVAIELEKVIVRDQAAARRHGHLGSPTVLVSGRDIEPGARGSTAFGLT
jgi:hypothetical protein